MQSLKEDDSVQRANQLILEKRFKGPTHCNQRRESHGHSHTARCGTHPGGKIFFNKLAEIMTQNVGISWTK